MAFPFFNDYERLYNSKTWEKEHSFDREKEGGSCIIMLLLLVNDLISSGCGFYIAACGYI